MTDRAVPNLPSRDLVATADFYRGFGFRELHRDDNWLVLSNLLRMIADDDSR